MKIQNKKDEIKKSYSEIMMENIKNEFERYVMEQEMKIQNRNVKDKIEQLFKEPANELL